MKNTTKYWLVLIITWFKCEKMLEDLFVHIPSLRWFNITHFWYQNGHEFFGTAHPPFCKQCLSHWNAHIRAQAIPSNLSIPRYPKYHRNSMIIGICWDIWYYGILVSWNYWKYQDMLGLLGYSKYHRNSNYNQCEPWLSPTNVSHYSSINPTVAYITEGIES